MTDHARFEFDDDELSRIGAEAYLFLYPLVIMELTRRASTNVADLSRRGRAPMNALAHARAFPPGEFRTIVRPNFDTLYSTAWVDVAHEPMILSLPALPDDRFVMVPCYDMWTEVFASPGTRTNGTAPYAFALCEPTWRGELPADVERIDAPTSVVWILARSETRGVNDYEHIHQFQDAMTLSSLSSYPEPAPTLSSERSGDETKVPPMLAVAQMDANDFFSLASELLRTHRCHSSDWNTVARIRHVGIDARLPFEFSSLDQRIKDALLSAPALAAQVQRHSFGTMGTNVNGWQMFTETTGAWGNSYARRAIIAQWGLGANPPEESLYPSATVDSLGEPLHGENDYVIHFNAGQLPAVKAFWSLTAYDLQGYPVPNDLQRYALGDRDELEFNPDGSLDLYVASREPAQRTANWLPVAAERFLLTLRLYLPEPSVFDGQWRAPAITRVRAN
jgi:hypothetical protein